MKRLGQGGNRIVLGQPGLPSQISKQLNQSTSSRRQEGKVKSARQMVLLSTLLTGWLLCVLVVPSEAAYLRPGHTELATWPLNPFPRELAATASSNSPSLSATGRYVAFASNLPNLVSGDTNKAEDIFWRDMKTGATKLVSVSSQGTPAEGGVICPTTPTSPAWTGSHGASISADGRYVAFVSAASNLVPGDTNEQWDVFVRDMESGSIARASLAGTDQASLGADNGSCSADSPGISRSGDSVSFSSVSPDLIPNDTNNAQDVFVHDLKSQETTRVSLSDDDTQANGKSWNASMSADGRYVAFTTNATNLIRSTPLAAAGQVVVRDTKDETTTQVSVASDGTPADPLYPAQTSTGQAISANGRFVAFWTFDRNLVPNDSNAYAGGSPGVSGPDWFVHDLRTHRTERIEVDSYGRERDQGGYGLTASISADGRYVTFVSKANLSERAAASPPSGGVPIVPTIPVCTVVSTLCIYNVYVHDRVTGFTDAVSVTPDGHVGEKLSEMPSISGDGRHVAFASTSGILIDDTQEKQLEQNDPQYDRASNFRFIFVRDWGTDLGVDNLVRNGDLSVTPDDRGFARTGSISAEDSVTDLGPALTNRGANLYGASLAYRPKLGDLFADIELEHMPQVVPGVVSPIFYGLRFRVGDKSYEVRATSLIGGTFGLFEQDASTGLYTKVSDLKGGYGTTGDRVVFSLPLSGIGIQNGGELSDVTAFSGVGTYLSGAAKVLDEVALPKN